MRMTVGARREALASISGSMIDGQPGGAPVAEKPGAGGQKAQRNQNCNGKLRESSPEL